MAALFSAGSATARSETSRNLIEFRAGKMNLKGTRVIPDKRKGMFYIHRERETLLTHVCWKDRTTGVVEDDLIVFPDDCKWTRVEQCSTGRVYLLRFNSSTKKLFFWMQEPKDTKDVEYAEKINKVLNEPDDAASGGDLLANMSSTSTEQLLSQMFAGGGANQEQMLQQLFQSGALGGRLGSAGGAGSGSGSGGLGVGAAAASSTVTPRTKSAKTTEAPAAPNKSRPVSSQAPTPMQLADFQDIMSNISGAGGISQKSSQVNLASALPLDLNSLLSSQETISRLKPHVPQEPSDLIPDSSVELRQSLNSPQFRQALSMFSMAFATGQLGPVISQFNLGEEATTAANNGDLKAFVEALCKAAGKPHGQSPSSDEKGAPEGDNDEDDKKMDTSS